MTNSRKEYIVKLHNRMRNKLAMGEIKGYEPAAKMPCFVSDGHKIELLFIGLKYNGIFFYSNGVKNLLI